MEELSAIEPTNSAHNILLNVLDLQSEQFRIEGLEAVLQTCFEDFMASWSKGPAK